MTGTLALPSPADAAALTHDTVRLAVVVDPTLPTGLLANVVAVLSAGLGAARPGLGGEELVDAEGRIVRTSANRPIPILAAEPAAMTAVLVRALAAPSGGTVIPFPAFARTIHDFDAYRATFAQRRLTAEVIDGLALAGPAKWVRSLTGSLKLLR